MWWGPVDDTSATGAYRQALLYSSNGKAWWLGYEHDFLSGTSGRSFEVDRAAIQAVAEKGGTFEDFDQYDQRPLCGDDYYRLVPIGQFYSKQEGIRAAVKRLAAEIQDFPRDCVRIVWSAPADDKSKIASSRQALVSSDNWGDGEVRWVAYEHDSDSGARSRHYLVDRAAIQLVAEKGGTVKDFEPYDKRHPPNLQKGG
jgi:hypothetical protein